MGDVYALGVVRCVCVRVLAGVHKCASVQVLLELLVNQTIFKRESVVELNNGTLTAGSVADLDLGWTKGQPEKLLELADDMTELRYKQRPTAKKVGTFVISLISRACIQFHFRLQYTALSGSPNAHARTHARTAGARCSSASD